MPTHVPTPLSSPGLERVAPKTAGHDRARASATQSNDGVEAGAGVPVKADPVLSDSAIADRAFAKFKDRGSSHGRDQDDWETARHELMAEARLISSSIAS